MTEAVTVLARIVAQPGHGDEVAAILTELVRVVSKEEGVVDYSLNRGVDQPDVFWFSERYRDAAAFAVHGKDPEFGAIGARMGEHVVGAPEIIVSKPIAGL